MRKIPNREKPTTQFLKGFLRVGLPVTSLPNVIGVQLYGDLDGGHGPIARLQVDAGEQGHTPRARLILNPLGPVCINKGRIKVNQIQPVLL